MGTGNARYFKAPKEAVEQIRRFLLEEDWPRLSRYYDLRDSETSFEELESGRFFLQDRAPETAHPGLFWRYRHPFAPGFSYEHHTTEDGDEVTVVISIEIDQGDGMMQSGRQEFRMRRSSHGYQILPPA